MTIAAQSDSVGVTTIMLKNLPSRCRRDELREEVDARGFKNAYDFLYFPARDPTKKAQYYGFQNYGFAFINFLQAEIAQNFYNLVEAGFLEMRQKRISVAIADTQGLAELQERLRRSKLNKEPVAATFLTASCGATTAALSPDTAARKIPPTPKDGMCLENEQGVDAKKSQDEHAECGQVLGDEQPVAKKTDAFFSPEVGELPMPLKLTSHVSDFPLPMSMGVAPEGRLTHHCVTTGHRLPSMRSPCFVTLSI
eukprot:TRINITY_DN6575_c0_g3_i1.p1 TRINITY_DN6575_c0_g3~~TRINITY_DN6575_c0_g3_i1.p1  ORF type:complete len:279 (+),score=45.43 TRINITY_DN6575_c0_g3_i1:79-837(+)